jgi:hypothetical protein
MFDGQAHRPVHHQRIACVVPAGDVGRRDVLHHGLIGADSIPAKAFTQVTIEINLH